MFVALLSLVLLLLLVAAAYAGVVALGSRVTPVRYNPMYDTRHPAL